MAQIIKLKRSLAAGSKPSTSDLAVGELAMNVTDGKVFLRKSGSAGDNVKEIVTLDHSGTLSGSLNITGSITASAFSGDGSRLTGITVSQNATVKQSFTNSIYLAGGGQGSKYNKQLETERAFKRKLEKMKEFP